MEASSGATAIFAASHDHALCVADALAAAEALCASRGAHLTELRRRVLEMVWTSHKPIGAYDVLERLSRERGRVAPPTVYRALDFLLEQDLVHRIESLNAYVGCARPGKIHNSQFLICGECGAAAELHDPNIDSAILQRAQAVGFEVTHRTVEVQGLCPSCQKEAGDGAD
jgi:Fur family zinc uptake transcriptional regulator